MALLDGAGICLILVKPEPPMNPVLDDHGGLGGPRAYFHDRDGTVFGVLSI